jgi:peptide/nickel transport system permease protein
LDLLNYLLRRLGLSAFVFLAVMTITFAISHLIPGNPIAALLGPAAVEYPGLVTKLTQQYHLNDPIYVQYVYYLDNLAHGNLGYSSSKGFIPVSTVIAQTLPYTVQIVFFAFIFSIAFGIVFGVIAAKYSQKAADTGIRSVYLAGISSPSFFVALIFLIAFTFFFRILPSGGAVGPSIAPPSLITGIPMLDALLELNFRYEQSALAHVILPSLSLAVGATAIVIRVTRASMLQILTSNYVRTARAKGLSESTVLFKHALRNGMIPVVTLLSLLFYGMMGSTLFVENIFAYPGMGQYVITALTSNDYPGIMATTLIFAAIIITANIVADVLYAVVDPQVRLG